jgi:hypothetical protein
MAKEKKTKGRSKSRKGVSRATRNGNRKRRKAAVKGKRNSPNTSTTGKRKTKRKKTKEKDSAKSVEVKLAPTVEFLHRHISKALCSEVFAAVRNNERERKWTLFALSRFWLAVVLTAPPALSHLLEEARHRDPCGLLPHVEASNASFFEKCKGFSSEFFMALYHHLLDEVLPKAPTNYASDVAHLKDEFAEVAIIDGSRLDKIAHRLKILWDEEAAVLPGCLTAVYDLFRGVATQLWFDRDAAGSEFKRGMMAAECLARNSLLLGDRLYCAIQLFQLLQDNHCFGLFRRNRTVGIRKVRRLSKRKVEGGGTLEDWLVEAGKEKIELRLIVLRKGGKTYEALTNVLDPTRLSPTEIATLYPLRWQVERLFYDLKAVLNLKKFHCANPNAVAMQVYAAAMVHVAFRIAQSDIAEKVSVQPEELSPKKLFPRLALVSITVVEADHVFEKTCEANPGVKLRKPRWDDIPHGTVSLKSILRQRRSDNRRKRAYSENRRTWKSVVKVEEGQN